MRVRGAAVSTGSVSVSRDGPTPPARRCCRFSAVLSKTFRYAGGFLLHPRRACDAVAADPQGLWTGLWLGILFLGAYALTVLIYYLLGHQPVAEPFLIVPKESWYLVQSFTTLPVGMAGFLTYAGLAYTVARAWGGRGSYDATLSASMYGLMLPWVFFILSVELLVAPFLIACGFQNLPWPAWLESLRVFGLPIPWMFALCTRALNRVHGLAWWKSLIAAVTASIPMAGIMAVFIR